MSSVRENIVTIPPELDPQIQALEWELSDERLEEALIGLAVRRGRNRTRRPDSVRYRTRPLPRLLRPIAH